MDLDALLDRLAAVDPTDQPFISLYVDARPDNTGRPHWGPVVRKELTERARAFGERTTARTAYDADAERILGWLDAAPRASAQGFAIFACEAVGLFEGVELNAPVETELVVGHVPHLYPLARLLDQGRRYAVVVTDTHQAHIFVVALGAIRERARVENAKTSRSGAGGWSQARFQRHIETLVQDHLRRIADELDALVRRLHGPQVVVISSEGTRAEFDDLLSKEARAAIVGWTHAEAHAQAPELLSLATPVLERWRAEQETRALERWREEAGRNGSAAAGWKQTLEAASDGRVELLLFQEGAGHAAARCPRCGRVAVEDGKCPLDGTSMERSDDGLDLAVHQTLVHGGTVWAVRHHHDLEPVEGIGALLRY
jgi:peptide chain release factor subunit 1